MQRMCGVKAAMLPTFWLLLLHTSPTEPKVRVHALTVAQLCLTWRPTVTHLLQVSALLVICLCHHYDQAVCVTLFTGCWQADSRCSVTLGQMESTHCFRIR